MAPMDVGAPSRMRSTVTHVTSVLTVTYEEPRIEQLHDLIPAKRIPLKPSCHRRSGRDVGCCDGERAVAVRGEGGSAVEASPAKPQDASSQDDKGQVRGEGFSPVLSLTQQGCQCKGGGAGADMHHGATSKVLERFKMHQTNAATKLGHDDKAVSINAILCEPQGQTLASQTPPW